MRGSNVGVCMCVCCFVWGVHVFWDEYGIERAMDQCECLRLGLCKNV